MPKVVHRQLLQENYLQKGKWEIREAKSFPPTPPNTTPSFNSVAAAHTSSPSSAPTNRKSPPPPSPLPAKAKPALFNQLSLRAHVGMLKLWGDWLCALQRAFSSGESDSASFPLFYFWRGCQSRLQSLFVREASQSPPRRDQPIQKLSCNSWPCCSSGGMQQSGDVSRCMFFCIFNFTSPSTPVGLAITVSSSVTLAAPGFINSNAMKILLRGY